MKSLKYIVFVVLSAMFSCQKEDIKPNNFNSCAEDEQTRNGMFIQSSVANKKTVNDKNLSEFEKDGSTDSENSSSDAGSISGGDINNTGGDGSESGGGITDPNNEPDVSKRKGKK